MHLKNLEISNFRKFSEVTSENENDNRLSFSNRIFKSSKPNSGDDTSVSNNDNNSGITLLAGKNNSGKSTVGGALKVLSGNNTISCDDINISALNNYLSKIITFDDADEKIQLLPDAEVEFPIVAFYFDIVVDNPKVSTNRLFDILPLDISLEDNNEFKFRVNYTLKAENEFLEEIKEFVKKYNADPNGNPLKKQALYRFFESKVNDYGFDENVFVNDIKESKFSVSRLIDFKIVHANKDFSNVDEKSLLSKSIGAIIANSNKGELKDRFQKLQAKLDDYNSELTEDFSTEYEQDVAKFIESLKSDEDLSVDIHFDILADTKDSKLIKYRYKDGDNQIKASQFGLGYTNLLYIIAETIDFINEQKSEIQNNIAILYIEEPEAFMHPQLQKKFISYIGDALKTKMEDTNLFVQVVVSTHSSNIVQSKIVNSNSLNYINLLSTFNKNIHCNILNDECVPEGKAKRKYFIQRLSLELCDVIFSDGIIAVEGDSEKILLPFYLENDKEINVLSKKNISLVGGFGRDFKNYFDFFIMLGIPTLIITDLDIKSMVDKELQIKRFLSEEFSEYQVSISLNDQEDCVMSIINDEKVICQIKDMKIISGDESDISDLKGKLKKYMKKDIIFDRITYGDLEKTPSFLNNTWITNYSIKEFYSSYILVESGEEEVKNEYNILNSSKKTERETNIYKKIILTTQNIYSDLTEESVIYTSFEEALLHANKGNTFVEDIVRNDRPDLFAEIESLYESSRYVQKKINHKTDIAIGILENNYEILENPKTDSKFVKLPTYIKKAIKELITMIGGES